MTPENIDNLIGSLFALGIFFGFCFFIYRLLKLK